MDLFRYRVRFGTQGQTLCITLPFHFVKNTNRGNISTSSNQTVVIKSVHYPCLERECEVLKRFQSRTLLLRPLIDEIEDPIDPPTLVLKHLDENLLYAASVKRLTGSEIKQVAKKNLEALNVVHEDGYVHTGTLPVNLIYLTNTNVLM
jgi:hypothetical protein